MGSRVRTIFPWLLSGTTAVLAVLAWGQSYEWRLDTLRAYQYFPALGLLAFSLLWSQYMVVATKDMWLKNVSLEAYFRYTGYAVLTAIVLHPSILVYQRFRDGFGLPPHSYETYVAPGLGWITLLGTGSLAVFLAFELHRWYSNRTWWKFVIIAGDMAMITIFYHGLRLGSQLHGGWFRVVWWVYGTTLVLALGRKYLRAIMRRDSTAATKRLSTRNR